MCRGVKIAGIAVLVAASVSACAPAEDVTSSPSPSQSSESPRSTPLRTPVYTPTPTPTPTPASLLEQIEFSCSTDDEVGRTRFATLGEAWEYTGEVDLCDVEYGNGDRFRNIPRSDLSDVELKAVQTSYPDDPIPHNVRFLYGICASNSGIPVDEVVSAGQARELSGALLLCPDHPKIQQMKVNAGSQDAMRAEEDALEADRENGRLVGSGNYLVGTEVPAGTWRAQGEKITDCYWEISDSNGNIIANNFVSTSTPFSITIPSHASGFTVEGCSFRWTDE